MNQEDFIIFNIKKELIKLGFSKEVARSAAIMTLAKYNLSQNKSQFLINEGLDYAKDCAKRIK